jgi:hypothetical protein
MLVGKEWTSNALNNHHTVQNALLSIMAEIALKETASEAGSIHHFSILADESTDLSKKQQVTADVGDCSLCLFNGSVHEEFIGY